VAGVDLLAWATQHRVSLEQQLLRHGALLFRGFAVQTAEDFSRLISALYGQPLEYHERSSPRSQVSGHIYTSTDHPPDQAIFLHNENSYQPAWPLRICFFCKLPALQGGQTPLADMRRIYARLPARIRERFAEKQVLYVRNFGDGLGLPWQEVFQTQERARVEAYCRETGMSCEWKDHNRLRTRRIGQAVICHPQTREMLWFNHAVFFHVSTLPPQVRAVLLRQFQVEDLPANTYYGDGTPIEEGVLDELRQLYQEETVAFPWQQGDVLLLDNMLVAHGRAPFCGPRQVLTGMAQPFAGQSGNEQV
jgi:alpha-ketoglutarate-dependent taurine dioxygenase